MPCARKRSAGHSPPYRPEGQISRNSLLNSLLAGNFAGDWREQHCIASHAVPPLCRSPERCQKGPPTAAFAFGRQSRDSHFAFLAGPNRRKSPAVFENIPVSRRLRPETWFERHCRVRAAVMLEIHFSISLDSPDWRGSSLRQLISYGPAPSN